MSTLSTESDFLRIKAEKLLELDPEENDLPDKSDLASLVHELRVHQIELEIQNDELRRIQHIAEESRKRYFDLFENSPVGYVILDPNGIIKQFNKAFLKMTDQKLLESHTCAFADFLQEEDSAVFHSRFKAILKHPENKEIRVRLKAEESELRPVVLKAATHEKTRDKKIAELVFAVMMI